LGWRRNSVLVDGVVDGKPRKLLIRPAAMDTSLSSNRTNGEHILTNPFIDTGELG